MTPDMAMQLLTKFANHKEGCNCFVCRRLTEEQKGALAEVRAAAKAPAYLTENDPPARHAAAALAAIRGEASAFNMRSWFSGYGSLDGAVLKPDVHPSSCGTTLCAAGWIAHNAGYKIYPCGWTSQDCEQGSHVEGIAAKLLGGSSAFHDLGWIFYSNGPTALNALTAIAEGRTPTYDECTEADPEDED